MSSTEIPPDARVLPDVLDLLHELPRREGQPCMVPFGPVAFFPGQLVDTHTVFMQRAAAAGGAAAAVAGKPASECGQLEEMTPVDAAERLQSLRPAGAGPDRPQQQQSQPPQPPQPAQQQSQPQQPPQPQQQIAIRQPPQAQRVADPGGGQQLANLVGVQSPENLDALRQVLQQLGSAVEEQAVAGGQLPRTEGKEVVDIREEYDEAVHGPLEEAACARYGCQRGAAHASDSSTKQTGGEEGASDDGSSVDSFEDLMQRMEALEVGTPVAAAGYPAAGGAAGLAAAGPVAAATAAAQQGAGHADGATRRPGGFKPGFLLGKQLEPKQPLPTAAPQQQGQRGQQADSVDAATLLRWRREEEAARRREGAFTGAVVERQPASAPPPALAVPARQQPGQPDAASQPQAQRVSKFKLRRQGLD